MSAPRGFVLPVVLAALIIMAMAVAIAAQRALIAARVGTLELANADLAVAAALAEVTVLESPANLAVLAGAIPGTELAAGTVTAARASAKWTLLVLVPPFATAEVQAQVPVHQGTARVRLRALVVPRADSAAGVRWAIAAGGGWTRIPSL